MYTSPTAASREAGIVLLKRRKSLRKSKDGNSATLCLRTRICLVWESLEERMFELTTTRSLTLWTDTHRRSMHLTSCWIPIARREREETDRIVDSSRCRGDALFNRLWTRRSRLSTGAQWMFYFHTTRASTFSALGCLGCWWTWKRICSTARAVSFSSRSSG